MKTPTAKLDQSIDRISATLCAIEFTISDCLETISEFANADPGIAYALGKHLADVYRERRFPDHRQQGEPMMEAYRRTFISVEHAPMYGTERFLSQPDVLLGMFSMLAESLADAVKQGGKNTQAMLSATSDRAH